MDGWNGSLVRWFIHSASTQHTHHRHHQLRRRRRPSESAIVDKWAVVLKTFLIPGPRTTEQKAASTNPVSPTPRQKHLPHVRRKARRAARPGLFLFATQQAGISGQGAAELIKTKVGGRRWGSSARRRQSTRREGEADGTTAPPPRARRERHVEKGTDGRTHTEMAGEWDGATHQRNYIRRRCAEYPRHAMARAKQLYESSVCNSTYSTPYKRSESWLASVGLPDRGSCSE